jgi:hypothetical protein
MFLGPPPGGLLKDTIVISLASGSCVYKDQNTYTYTQGVMASALAELYQIYGDPSYLDWAISILDTVRTQLVSVGVVFYAPEENFSDGLIPGQESQRYPSDDDAFKGILLRNMREVRDIAAAAGRPVNTWTPFFHAQVNALVQGGRSGWAEFGKHFAGPVKFPSYITFATQQSAVDAFNAVYGI